MLRGLKLLNTRPLSASAQSSGAFVQAVSPVVVWLQNLSTINWTDPGGFRGFISRAATNVWNGAMYVNKAFAGGFGTALYDANLGPLGVVAGIGSNFSFNPKISVSMNQAQILWLNTTTYGGCFCLALSPNVSGFLTESAWVGLPGIDITGDPRDTPFMIPLTGNTDRNFSDIPTNALFGGDWVL